MKKSKYFPILFCIIVACNGCAMITMPLRRDCAKYSESHVECKIETKGTISFEHKVGKVVANLKPSGELQASRICWPKTAASYRSIDPAKLYGLQYLRSRIGRGDVYSDWNDTTLLKIIDGAHILYDAAICPLHNEVMERQIEEEVSYDGYHPYRKGYFSGRSPRLCPNDGKAYLLCDAGIEHMTWRCPSCYKFSEEWRLKHGID